MKYRVTYKTLDYDYIFGARVDKHTQEFDTHEDALEFANVEAPKRLSASLVRLNLSEEGLSPRAREVTIEKIDGVEVLHKVESK